MSSLAGPLQLLRLFPSLAPPKLLAAAAAEQTEAAEAAGDGINAAVAAAAAAEGGEEAVPVEPTGEAFVAAVQVLTPYLLSHRSRLAAAAASPGPKPLRGAAAAPAGQQLQLPHTPAVAAAAARAAEAAAGPSPATRAALVQQRLEGSATAALLDTALLLALLAVPDSGALLRWGRMDSRGGGAGRPHAGPACQVCSAPTAVPRHVPPIQPLFVFCRYVQRPNCVDLEAGEAALKEAGRYSELVALYEVVC